MARPRSFDEDQVVRAVQDRFWDFGYAETSLDDLTDVTQLGRGSLYGAFGDKHALFLRALDRYSSGVVTAWRESLDEADALQALRAHVRNFAARVVADGARRGCMIAKSTAERGPVDAEVTARARAAFNEMLSVLTHCIERAQKQGSIARDADPAALAAVLFAVLRGVEAVSRGGIDPQVVTSAAEQALSLLPTASAEKRR
jgi:TetR/AcrR family transcriptional repressor of nem operon